MLSTTLSLPIGYYFQYYAYYIDASSLGHISAYMLDVLHWLSLHQRIIVLDRCIGAMVWRCILGLAPAYLRDLCCPTSGTRDRSSLRSSEQGLLFVPFARTSTNQVHAFSMGPVFGRIIFNMISDQNHTYKN